jgi:hypothetical protein
LSIISVGFNQCFRKISLVTLCNVMHKEKKIGTILNAQQRWMHYLYSATSFLRREY